MKYIASILLAFVMLTSCQDFLEEKPTTQYSAAEIYNNSKTVESALNGLYSTLISYENYGYRLYYTTQSTSGIFTTTKQPAGDLALGRLEIATNDNNVEKTYMGQYATIGVANDILYYLNQPDNQLAAPQRNKVIGEASFIRALSYFNLVRLFGRVSLITTPVMSYQESQTPRDSVVRIYRQIIRDLNTAWATMPAPTDGSLMKAGRPHKYAAKAMLAKVYLTMATSEELTNEQKVGAFDSAYAYAKAVYDANVYSLVPKYSDLFLTTKKNSLESIFELQFNALVGTMRLTETTMPGGSILIPNSDGSNWGKTRPTLAAYDRFTETYPGDPRLAATFLGSPYTVLTAGVQKIKKCYPEIPTGADRREYMPYIRKYVDPTYNGGSNCNFMVYRYADLLLILAEAANELGHTDEAIGYANLVLKRARDSDGNGSISATELVPADWAAGLSQAQVRDKIMIERQIELLGEGNDWFNTHRRFDYYKQIIARHNTRLTTMPVWTGVTVLGVFKYPDTEDLMKKNLLLPFPANEIIRNEAIPQDDQNYGYGSAVTTN